MAEILPTEVIDYRVLLIDPESHKVCALGSNGRYRLIRVAVAQRTRLARELQKALRDKWRVAVLILDILPTAGNTQPCAIAEILGGKLPTEFEIVQPEQLLGADLSEQEYSSLLAMLGGQTKSPFGAVGWIDEAIRWIEGAMGTRASSKFEVEQHNAGGGFTLVRFGVQSGCDYWLKATGDPNTHESQVTSLLSRLCCGYVPEVVAERPEWNAWVMRSEGAAALPVEAPAFARFLESAVESLAELQLRTVGGELELHKAGARDHRTHVLRADAETIFAYISEAMGLQTSTKVSRVETERLRELQKIFENACSCIEDLDLPDTVLHGDMNLGNIVLAGERCVFIDWCEAYIGNPLITFEHLLLLNQIEDPSLKASCELRLRETYRAAMSRVCDSKAIDAAFVFMPLLAAVSTIFGPGEWMRTPARNDPRRQAYVRGIARHMDRAARAPSFLTALSGSTKSRERLPHATCS